VSRPQDSVEWVAGSPNVRCPFCGWRWVVATKIVPLILSFTLHTTAVTPPVMSLEPAEIVLLQELELFCNYTASDSDTRPAAAFRLAGRTARSVVKRTPCFSDLPMRWSSQRKDSNPIVCLCCKLSTGELMRCFSHTRTIRDSLQTKEEFSRFWPVKQPDHLESIGED